LLGKYKKITGLGFYLIVKFGSKDLK